MRRQAIAAAAVAAAAASAGACAGTAWAAPWIGAGLAVAAVLGVLGWALAAAGVTAEEDGIRATLPRMALGLPWPPMRRARLQWDGVRSVRLARRGTRTFGPTPDDGAVLPCDVATIAGMDEAIVLRADVFGDAAIRLASRAAARRGLTVEPG
ncbi:MAG: hypothetical protein AB7K86_10795 [Rhodospirillales bacterium]